MKLLAPLLLLISLPFISAVKEHDFKKCNQSGFCRRGRALASRAEEAGPKKWKSPYTLDSSTVSYSNNKSILKARVKSSLYPDIKFELEVRIHKDGVVRIRMDEVGGLKQRYNEAASWALIKEPELKSSVSWKSAADGREIVASYDNGLQLRITSDPLVITLFRGGKEEIVLNGRGLFHMEHFRTKDVPAPEDVEEQKVTDEGSDQTVISAETKIKETAWFEGDSEDAYWEESFGTWTDSKPKGPESLSLDISFPHHANVYGIPSHASPLSLPTTTGADPTYSDPYRLYNLDVFQYDADSPMSLYGAIPLLHAHSEKSTVGVWNVLASETWIDVSHPTFDSTSTHWISESGILDLFLLPGPTSPDVFSQYTALTGTPYLPPLFSIAYHQCRWNYITSDDVRSVAKRFDEEDMPLDVIWLDIEYSEEHKYFMWNDKMFPDPVEMVNDVASAGRKMVVIVDPHLKRVSTYPVYSESQSRDVLIKNSQGNEYEGWCWSGSSAWVDFFNPDSWDWWKGLYRLKDVKGIDGWRWEKSTENVHIWNDMNEPSVFNGPEITMPKDNIHYGGWEHRDVHNINGMLFQNQTSRAIQLRGTEPKRPFVLSRSFYSGSQRFGAVWTGDNMGTWEHMKVGVPMVLGMGLGGITFSGADVGGFFGNPDSEMLTRWYQVGAFAPFFRAHAHIDTKRREPYLLDEPYKSIIRDVLRLRYALLPVWYNAFRETSVSGIPILRPQYIMFPTDKKGFAIDDQYYLGSSGLLVKPVTDASVTETEVYLAEDQVYYDYFSHSVYRGHSSGKNIIVPSPLDKFPLLIRGGSLLPLRLRPRRSSRLMHNDPFTLVVALDNQYKAQGELYLDDGESYKHEKGEVVWREFKAGKDKKGVIRITNEDLVKHSDGKGVVDGVTELGHYTPENNFAKSLDGVVVERLVLLGMEKKPKNVRLEDGKELEWTFKDGVPAKGKKEGAASELIIKYPGVKIPRDWTVLVEF